MLCVRVCGLIGVERNPASNENEIWESVAAARVLNGGRSQRRPFWSWRRPGHRCLQGLGLSVMGQGLRFRVNTSVSSRVLYHSIKWFFRQSLMTLSKLLLLVLGARVRVHVWMCVHDFVLAGGLRRCSHVFNPRNGQSPRRLILCLRHTCVHLCAPPLSRTAHAHTHMRMHTQSGGDC